MIIKKMKIIKLIIKVQYKNDCLFGKLQKNDGLKTNIFIIITYIYIYRY